MKRRSIFIGSSMNGIPIARVLANLLADDFQVIQWTGSPSNPGEPLIQSLRSIAEEVALAVFVLPHTDINTHYCHEGQLRSNLLFELGLFVGLVGLNRICLVVPRLQSIKLPTYLHGLTALPYDTHDDSDLSSTLAPAVSHIQRMISSFAEPKEQKAEFYSCFISYSSHNQTFVSKLYEDLRIVGVQCWLDEKDLRIGQSLAGQISRAIEVHDKVLLVLSEASVKSKWVNTEIRNVFSLETKRNRIFLFPIRIDDAIFAAPGRAALDFIRSRHIGDFTNWQDAGSYQKAFSRLIRDLSISTSVESGSKGYA